MLSFPAVILLIKAVTSNYPSKGGWAVLALLLALHIIILPVSFHRIKNLDSKTSDYKKSALDKGKAKTTASVDLLAVHP